MRKLILAFGLLLCVSAGFAQAPLSKGGMQLNAGLGFASNTIPLHLGLDYGATRDFTLGAEFMFSTKKSGNYNHYWYGFYGTGNYHFNRILQMPSEWNFYAGLNVGFVAYQNNYDNDHDDDIDNVSGLGLGLQVGGRYFFTNKIGLNLELHGGTKKTGGKIGLTFKI